MGWDFQEGAAMSTDVDKTHAKTMSQLTKLYGDPSGRAFGLLGMAEDADGSDTTVTGDEEGPTGTEDQQKAMALVMGLGMGMAMAAAQGRGQQA